MKEVSDYIEFKIPEEALYPAYEIGFAENYEDALRQALALFLHALSTVDLDGNIVIKNRAGTKTRTFNLRCKKTA